MAQDKTAVQHKQWIPVGSGEQTLQTQDPSIRSAVAAVGYHWANRSLKTGMRLSAHVAYGKAAVQHRSLPAVKIKPGTHQ